MKPFPSRSRFLKHALLSLLAVPCALLWGELFTRILLPQNVDSRMNIFQSDPVIGYTYKPGSSAYEKGREYNALYRINRHGLRDREYGAKPDGVFRVLLIGDSFSVSHGLSIEDSLSRQMEAALQNVVESEGLDVRIEVVNAAHGGYSPYNYWKAYSRWAPVFDPDVVVVGLSPDDYDCKYEYSDYVIEEGMTISIVRNGEQRRKGSRSPVRALRKWLSWHSQFYILMRNFLYYNETVGRLSLLLHARDVETNIQFQQYMVPMPESMRRNWEKTFSYLRNLRDEADANGDRLLLVPIPLKMEIDRDKYRQTLTSGNLKPEQIDIDQPLAIISDFCKAEHIPLLDPRGAIRARHAESPCYFTYDDHWIADGIGAAVASIADQWRSMDLPPWGGSAPETMALSAAQ